MKEEGKKEKFFNSNSTKHQQQVRPYFIRVTLLDMA